MRTLVRVLLVAAVVMVVAGVLMGWAAWNDVLGPAVGR